MSIEFTMNTYFFKRFKIIILCLFVFALALPAMANEKQEEQPKLNWDNLPALPDKFGFGGPFAGTHKKALIVVGGANFPDNPPWGPKPNAKKWYNHIFVLPSKDAKQWIKAEGLPKTLAYGVSISTPEGLILVGGEEDGKAVADVYRLQWNPETQKVNIQTLPSLPKPSSYTSGGILNNKIYIVASHRSAAANTLDEKSFWELDLSHIDENGKTITPENSNGAQKNPAGTWVAKAVWPGKARHKAVVATQSGGGKKSYLYMFSGGSPYVNADGSIDLTKFEYYTDSYRYDPKADSWKQIADLPMVKEKRDLPDKDKYANVKTPVAAGSAIDVGQTHILVFSGSTGRYVTLPVEDRPFFPKHVLTYHTITDTWQVVGEMPTAVVTTAVTKWEKQNVIVSGEVRPGVRTNKVQTVKLSKTDKYFGTLNFIVLGSYMVLLVGMGVYFSKREKSTDDFFMAGKRIPWWAAGLSIYATQLSAITFVAIPAVAYSTDWLTLPAKICILLMAPIVVIFYLPFFRRLNVTTAYEYLERRFNLTARLFGSVSFLIFQLLRMAIVVYLPAITLAQITGLNVYECIVAMGVLSIVYTVLGGMEAVIWTDVLQVFVLLGGMILAMVLIIFDVGGIDVVYNTALADGKLKAINWSFDSTEMATIAVILGTFLLQFGPYTTDQAVIQRYLTTKSEKEAAKGIWLNGLMSIPFGFLFLVLGTCLYVFFKFHPQDISLGMTNDEIFPLFMANHLGDGWSGLVVAGVFAASMSSLDSSMHSISTAVTVDFYRRFKPEATDHDTLKLARTIVIAMGVVAIILSSLCASMDLKSLFFAFQKVIGLVSSGLVGLFILGIFTNRTSAKAALTGAFASIVVLAYVTYQTDTHFYWYAVIGISTCVIGGLVMSFVFPNDKELTGLTYRNQLEAEES